MRLHHDIIYIYIYIYIYIIISILIMAITFTLSILLQLTPLYCLPVLNRPVLLQEEGSSSAQHTPSLVFLCKP